MSATTLDSPRPHVLVAVADPIARELLGRMLHLAGFTALPAETGERALVLLREHRRAIDWLVAGASLPGLVDAAILNDEFQTVHPARAALLLAAPERPSAGGPAAFSAAEVVNALQALAGDGSSVPAVPTARQESLAA